MKTTQIPESKIALLHKSLEEMFDFAPPNSLRKSILYVFFNYLGQKDLIRAEDFGDIVSDFYFLINFLEEAEDVMDGKIIARSPDK